MTSQTVSRETQERPVVGVRRLKEPMAVPPKTRVLTVANQKGGVGKTTSTVNLAAALAMGGLRVLVIDLDPQGNASTALGVDHHTAGIEGLFEVLVEDRPFSDVLVKVAGFDQLECAPATLDLAGAEIQLVPMVAREHRLRRSLTRLLAEREKAGARLDYVLIDCPPSLGLLTLNALVAAEELLIPIQCEYYALEGVTQLLRTLGLVTEHLNENLVLSTVLLTMYDGRTRLAADVAANVRESFPDAVLNSAIPRSVRISEAPSYGQTVMTYDPLSPGAIAYLEAAREIADRATSKESTK
ncbi:sporulation initiation inhibitor protein Soj [mine drainage metagenome]|uniref:Sporulation initiation inhibitor protein Soj n=1 Tax=mine drainage metagenome TaxID=410659 RepID=A0A1J5QB65_9ZZZZ